ncbi:hypothetical protein OG474_39395 [Kribbella sp. NBC_01505]|uniref:hypothetical protein n=1 Tax=Kribbella sp. NBC_01505 TaxID=2903580 RepID=UPI00387000E7
MDVRARDKASALTEKVWATYSDIIATPTTGLSTRRPVLFTRFMRQASKAAGALFRIIHTDLDDPAPRIAYGQILMTQAKLYSAGRGSGGIVMTQAIGCSRAALWALYGAELGGGVSALTALSAEAPVSLSIGGDDRLITARERLGYAATARLRLAEGLAANQPGKLKYPCTPAHVHDFLRSADKLHFGDADQPSRCQLESCWDYDSASEAEVLTAEANRIFEFRGPLET